MFSKSQQRTSQATGSRASLLSGTATASTSAVQKAHISSQQRRFNVVIAQAAAAADATSQQQQPQQQQALPLLRQPGQQQQPQKQQRRFRKGPFPPPLTNKPFIVRIAGRTSSIQGAAGAITKRLQTDDLIRVVAIDAASVPKAAVALSVANNMLGANRNQMVVFQPVLVTNNEDAPKVPAGSMVMYTSQILKGEVLAENWMPVKAGTDRQHLSGAIAARIREAGHTILECYGSTAVTTAIQALALARKYLKSSNQDIACLIASGRKAPDIAEGAAADAGTGGDPAAAAAAAAASAVAAASGSGSSSQYPATCHRLVVLECKPSQPRKLLLSQSVGMTG